MGPEKSEEKQKVRKNDDFLSQIGLKMTVFCTGRKAFHQQIASKQRFTSADVQKFLTFLEVLTNTVPLLFAISNAALESANVTFSTHALVSCVTVSALHLRTLSQGP